MMIYSMGCPLYQVKYGEKGSWMIQTNPNGQKLSKMFQYGQIWFYMVPKRKNLIKMV